MEEYGAGNPKNQWYEKVLHHIDCAVLCERGNGTMVSTEFHQEIPEPTTTVDVSGMKNGVYFVRVTGERTVQVGKFVKNLF
jgi:hypothetical protein